MFKKVKKIHFVGIGGIGMSGIAEILSNLGYVITGSDISESKITKNLEKNGVKIYLGHKAENVGDSEVVVYSSAVPITNPELQNAKERKIPIIPRAEMLNELMRLKTGIAISGTHGKTTTTSMVAEILAEAKQDPTYVIGGKLNSINSNAKLGKGEYLVFEACEAFGSFLYFSPIIMTVLNIDSDHMEYYETMDSLRNAFLEFINKIPFYGKAIVNNDDQNINEIIEKTNKKIITFGLNKKSDYMAKNIKYKDWACSFDVFKDDDRIGKVELNLPGEHNIYNALSAVAISLELDISFKDIKNALSKFVNADRRFQIKGQVEGVTVVDDYAHHPAEVKATLEAAKNNIGKTHKRIIAVFQPHLYSRTQALYKDFGTALEIADYTVLASIYPAREKPIPGVTSQLISDTMKKNGYNNFALVEDLNKLSKEIIKIIQPNDLVIFLGAGSIWRTAEEFLELLKREKNRFI